MWAERNGTAPAADPKVPGAKYMSCPRSQPEPGSRICDACADRLTAATPTVVVAGQSDGFRRPSRPWIYVGCF